ncbi:MAG: hypothetical protein HYX74_04670, partial [Acidobacteria bacterium]|nr:hypothetical protein [Acidobacteriota bacterium]
MNGPNRAARRRSGWRIWLQLSRISNLPTIATNCLAGATLANPAPPGIAVAAAALALSLFYIGGM